MKVIRIVVIVLAAALVLASCSSMAQGAMSGALGAVTSGKPAVASGGGSVAGAAAATADFQAGEILASADNGQEMDASFHVAKVLQAATVATKNQAQVVFIADGNKSWVNFVVNSRKATKSDFAVGATVLFLAGWSNHDEIPADRYRKDRWELGNVTSLDSLYKNYVEIGGQSYLLTYLRVPTDPIK